MSLRTNKLLLVLLLGLIVLDSGFTAYFPISFGSSMTSLLRGLGLKVGNARMAWDDWFFIGVSLASGAGLIGILLRSRWGRLVSLFALGAYEIWATAIALIPQSWRQAFFSTWVDRWVASMIATVTLVGCAWLFSRQAKAEFQ